MPRTLKLYTEWGINLKNNLLPAAATASSKKPSLLKRFKSRLWFNIFLKIAAVFAVFVLVLALCNVGFLVKFFSLKEKKALKEQLINVSRLDFDDSDAVIKSLSEINEKFNFDVEIYNAAGRILYTTHGGQMMDYFSLKNNKFVMAHEEMQPIKSEKLGDGIIFKTAIRRFDNSEYLLCTKNISESLTAEVRVQKRLISNSAAIANEFIIIISVICFIGSVIWVLIFARQFSKPIAEMNEITENMAALNFSRRLKSDRTDEIGQLAGSINRMSDSLSTSLRSLEATNKKLRDDIELERQLDVMRRGFVANVSHELKTPISIISGYAEGLKLNINSDARQEYCDTIIDESQRMNRLVLSILELSRYESGQMPINRQSFDISVMCRDMMNRIFKGKNVKTVLSLPDNSFVFADPVQIEQVLKSYLENAAAHTPDGGEVKLTVTALNEITKISVFNTGSHVDDELMPQIWQSFFRGDASHKRQSSRFGLGLSIVSAIMKMHGRECGVYNTENGVCFWFTADSAEGSEQ